MSKQEKAIQQIKLNRLCREFAWLANDTDILHTLL